MEKKQGKLRPPSPSTYGKIAYMHGLRFAGSKPRTIFFAILQGLPALQVLQVLQAYTNLVILCADYYYHCYTWSDGFRKLCLLVRFRNLTRCASLAETTILAETANLANLAPCSITSTNARKACNPCAACQSCTFQRTTHKRSQALKVLQTLQQKHNVFGGRS
jgi:hypothetical protein